MDEFKVSRRKLYWLVSSPFVLLMVYFAWGSLANVPALVQAVMQLGYPPYVLEILGIANLLGVIAIIVGKIRVLKEWAYAGITFNLIAASISHVYIEDHTGIAIVPLLFLVPVVASYYLWNKYDKKF
jgi:hypothetical protein